MSELDDIKVIVNVKLKGLETDTIEVISNLFNGECACEECMIEEEELEELKELESEVKTFPEYYINHNRIYQRKENYDGKRLLSFEKSFDFLGKQICDLLNNGTLKVED